MFEKTNSYSEKLLSGKTYVLLIAIDEYKDDLFRELSNPVLDSKLIFETLEKYKTDNIETLKNESVTKKNINDKLNELSKEIKENDNLIIFWGGHGKEKEGNGYLILNDSTSSETTWLAYYELIKWLEKINARHITLLINSCFAGSIFSENRGEIEESVAADDMKKQSRWGLVSGSQEVSDGKKDEGSPFATALGKYLNENEKDFVSVREMTKHIKSYVKEKGYFQDPQDGIFDIKKHKNGIFYFQLRENEETLWETTLNENTIDGYYFFIKKFPDGTNAIKAREKLVKLERDRNKLITFFKGIFEKLEVITTQINTDNKFYAPLQREKEANKNRLEELTIKESVQKDWSGLEKSEDIYDWEKFISKYENSDHSSLVEDYLEKGKEVRRRLRKDEKDLDDWKEIVSKTRYQKDITKIQAAYTLYLFKHPHGNQAGRARELIKEIEFYQKAINESNQYKRTKLLEEYQNRYNPTGLFLDRAKNILNADDIKRIKREEESQLEVVKLTNSIEKLQAFILDTYYSEEIRKKAKISLQQLKGELKEGFLNAKNAIGVGKLYSFLKKYQDGSEYSQAKELFDERVQEAYEGAMRDVRIQKSTAPIDSYLLEFKAYEEYEICNIKLAKQEKESFDLDIKEFNDAEKLGEKENYLEYLKNNKNGLFVAEAEDVIKKLEGKEREKILYKKCIEEKEITDLRIFKVEYPASEHIPEITLILVEKEKILNAQKLFKEINELIEIGNREQALQNIYAYLSNFQDEKDYAKVDQFKDQILLWKEEEEKYQEILITTNFEIQRNKCFKFLANDKYTRRHEDVDKLLMNKKANETLSKITNNLSPPNAFPVTLKDTPWWAILIIILLILLVASNLKIL